MIPFDAFPTPIPITVSRRLVGTISTDLDPSRASERLDLRRALSATDVRDLLARLPHRRAKRPWYIFAPRLMVTMALTAKQVAMLDTRQLAFRSGRAWLTVPEAHGSAGAGLSVRSMPLHRSLDDLRLVGFAHSRYFAMGGEGPLFPDLAAAERPGDAIDSWLRRAGRWLTDEGRHAPTANDLRSTCAQAALDGGASVHAVEWLMGLPVSHWDDRGPLEGEAWQRLRDEWAVEAIEAVHFPGLVPEDPDIMLSGAVARRARPEERPHAV